MKVKIKTVFGKFTFDLAKNHVLALVRQATEYAGESEEVEPVEKEEEPPLVKLVAPEDTRCSCEVKIPEQKDHEPATEKKAPVLHGSRAEAMFGQKADWDMPGKEEEVRDTYTGFIYARCESCGKEKGFCTKLPISFHKCECGHKTVLSNLRLAVVRCKCGSEFKYKTNIKDRVFTIPCLKCGSPVDLEMNKDWTAYNTIR